MTTMGDWIAVVALALSVLSLWLQFGERRRADPIVRLVRVERLGNKYPQTQLVITNAGAAAARGLSIEARDSAGDYPQFFRGADRFPIQIIAPAHEYRLNVALMLGGPASLTLTVQWRDRRPVRQHRTTVVSLSSIGTS